MGKSEITVFMGGPITHLTNPDSINVQQRELFYELNSKLVGLCNVYSAHIEEDFGKIIFSPEEITQRDFEWIKNANILFFIFPNCIEKNLPIRTDGTFIEIGYAAALRKKTIVFTPDINGHSPMMKGLFYHMPWELESFSSSKDLSQKAIRIINDL